MGTKFMPNKSNKCNQKNCERNGKVPIYFRDSKTRSFKVAFYVCVFCMNFSGFINWTTLRSMPYFNDMQGLVSVRLVNNSKDNENDVITRKDKVIDLKKQFSGKCFKCKLNEISKLYLRNNRNKPRYVGYVCKKCRIIYLLNTPDFMFSTLDPIAYYKEDGTLPKFHGIPFDEYIGQFATQIGEEEKEPKVKDLHFLVNDSDAKKIERFITKQKINILSREY